MDYARTMVAVCDIVLAARLVSMMSHAGETRPSYTIDGKVILAALFLTIVLAANAALIVGGI